MPLSNNSVQEFEEIFKKEYGKEYTYAEIREAAENLLGFFDLLIKVNRHNNIIGKSSLKIPLDKVIII